MQTYVVGKGGSKATLKKKTFSGKAANNSIQTDVLRWWTSMRLWPCKISMVFVLLEAKGFLEGKKNIGGHLV